MDDIYKRNNSLSVDIVAFEKCNLNCIHCFESHKDKTIDISKVSNIKNILIDYILNYIKNKPNTTFVKLSMRGGELFQDIVSDGILNEYLNIFNHIKQEVKKNYPHIPVTSHVMSNGIFKKRERVINFLKESNSVITLSYDVHGRYPSKEYEDIFFETYHELKKIDNFKNIAITLTKPAIQKYINNESALCKIDKSILFDLNYYIPTKNWKDLLPTDDETFLFFKYITDNNLFNFMYLSELLKHLVNSNYPILKACSCKHLITFQNGKIITSCNTHIPNSDLKDFYGKSLEKMTEKNAVDIIHSIGMTKRGCFLCPYFNNCSGCCWMQIANKNYQITECPHHKLRKYIEDNPDILQRYIEWKEKI